MTQAQEKNYAYAYVWTATTKYRSGIRHAQGYLPHVVMLGQWKYSEIQITWSLKSLEGSDDFPCACVCVEFRFHLDHPIPFLCACPCANITSEKKA